MVAYVLLSLVPFEPGKELKIMFLSSDLVVFPAGLYLWWEDWSQIYCNILLLLVIFFAGEDFPILQQVFFLICY